MNGDLGRWIAVPLKAFNDAVEACTRSKTKRFPATALAGSTFSNGVEKLILGSIIPMTPPITVSTQNAAKCSMLAMKRSVAVNGFRTRTAPMMQSTANAIVVPRIQRL